MRPLYASSTTPDQEMQKGQKALCCLGCSTAGACSWGLGFPKRPKISLKLFSSTHSLRLFIFAPIHCNTVPRKTAPYLFPSKHIYMTQSQIKRPASWIPLLPQHLDRVNEIADEIHASLPERPEVLEEKCRLFPEGCRVLVRDDRVVGYAFSHPWLFGRIPPLDDFLWALPEAPTCLYLHDIVVLPEARGQKASERFLNGLESLAHQMSVGHLTLVSVYRTDALWSRHGFEVTKKSELEEKLQSYGPTAKYMTRALAE